MGKEPYMQAARRRVRELKNLGVLNVRNHYEKTLTHIAEHNCLHGQASVYTAVFCCIPAIQVCVIYSI
jgi:hypothetical protein